MPGLQGKLNTLERAIRKRFTPPVWVGQILAYTDGPEGFTDLFSGDIVEDTAIQGAVESGIKVVYIPGGFQI